MDLNNYITYTILKYLNEEHNIENNIKDKLKCIQSTLENIEKVERETRYENHLWVDIRPELRSIKNYFRDGYFISNGEEDEIKFKKFLSGLDFSDSHTYKRGEKVGKLPISNRGGINSDMSIYKAIGTKILFRGVSLNDWKRIKRQGFIDSDMRDAIVETEGINLGQRPSTGRYYLPANDKGVILAISPKNLDLYMLDDEYIRVFKPIPLKNIIKVSDIYIKNNEGISLSINTEKHINDIIDRMKKLGINLEC